MVKKSARRTRRMHMPVFKAKVALAALREDLGDGRAVQSVRTACKPDYTMEETVAWCMQPMRLKVAPNQSRSLTWCRCTQRLAS